MTSTLLMSMPISSKAKGVAKMKVVGIGHAGCGIINRMMSRGLTGVDFIAMDTDTQALALNKAPTRILLGEKLARGLGVSSDPEFAFKAAHESRHAIEEAIAGADVVLITVGMGGGTGTGSIPIVAEVARESDALTVALVTKPFSFEGQYRAKVAEDGIQKLSNKVDTLIIIQNDHLLELYDNKVSVDRAFEIANDTLFQAIQAICGVTMTSPGTINLDFTDIEAIMKHAGFAFVSLGRGSGRNRAVEAAKAALASPLIDVPISEAKGVLLSITGGSGLTLFECNEVAQVISQAVAPNANIIFGIAFDPEMGDDIIVTIIAMGFSSWYGRKAVGLGKLVREIAGFEEAKGFFEAKREKLLEKYGGSYIAILEGEVADADDDFSTLAERVYSRYGYKDIYMPKVERERAILHIPTPQIKRK